MELGELRVFSILILNFALVSKTYGIMKKHLLSFFCATLVAFAAQAGPADPTPRTTLQADGTMLTYRLTGDEWFACYRTLDGIPLVKLSDGTFCYARVVGDGLESTGKTAHDVALRTAEEQAFVASLSGGQADLNRICRNRRQRAFAQNGLVQVPAERAAKDFAPVPVKGKRKGLVVLAQYSDLKFTLPDVLSVFTQKLNGEGEAAKGTSSVKEYYKAMSLGQFELDFDVVGPVTLPNPMAYYGKQEGTSNDVRPAHLAADACKLVDAEVDFSKYVWDKEGEVSQVFVIFPGVPQSDGGDADNIWPHAWYIRYGLGESLTLDGVKVDRYACSGELRGDGKAPNGMGTICHEFGHCLGLADLYDIDYSGGTGLMNWSLMAGGNHIQSGNVPASLTAFERWQLGWINPVELNSPTQVKDLRPITDGGEAYVLRNDAYKNEFFLLENRLSTGFDTYTYANGLFITQVDYDANAWAANGPNDDPDHQRVRVIPADNRRAFYYTQKNYIATSREYGGDTYPGPMSNTSFTAFSTPAAMLWNKGADGTRFFRKPVTDIELTADGTVNFAFMGGCDLPAPKATHARVESQRSFRAYWEPVAGAVEYRVKAVSDATVGARCLLADHMKRLPAVTQAGTEDISQKLNNYMQRTGWGGSKIYNAPKGLQVGKGKESGQLNFPVVQPASYDGKITVRIRAVCDNDANLSYIQLFDMGRNWKVEYSEMDYVSSTARDYIFQVPNKNNYSQLVLMAGNAPVYIQKIEVYNGEMVYGDYKSATFEELMEKSVMDKEPFYAEKTTTETSVYFLAPTSRGKYKFYVKAVKDDGSESVWSKSKYADLKLPTGIAEIAPDESEIAAPVIYSLDGRKLESIPEHGVFVVNGKKVVK